MNIFINIPANANSLVKDYDRYFFLNAEITSDQITVTMNEENLADKKGNCIAYFLPCDVNNVEHVASFFAERVEDLLIDGSLILDDNCLIIDNPWDVLNVISSINFNL